MPYFEWKRYRLFYRQQGRGPLLVILPGNTASSAHLQADLAYFSDRFQTVALDFLGTGQSERVAVWADRWWYQGALQTAALIDHLGYKNAVLMGASGGAVAALLTAIHFPRSVRAVVADSFVEQAPPEEFRLRVIADRAQRTPGQIEFWRAGHGGDWEQVVDADTAMLERFADQGADWFQGQLDHIRCPVLLTASLRDPLIPGVAEQFCGMLEKIPDVRLYLHASGGHPLMWSEPDAFRAVSDYFLQNFLSGA
ncbi:MAG: alpha/beta fold hydrolase [Anaerolineales bacterium]